MISAQQDQPWLLAFGLRVWYLNPFPQMFRINGANINTHCQPPKLPRSSIFSLAGLSEGYWTSSHAFKSLYILLRPTSTKWHLSPRLLFNYWKGILLDQNAIQVQPRIEAGEQASVGTSAAVHTFKTKTVMFYMSIHLVKWQEASSCQCQCQCQCQC